MLFSPRSASVALTRIELWNNELEGELLAAISHLPNLMYHSVSTNRLASVVPKREESWPDAATPYSRLSLFFFLELEKHRTPYSRLVQQQFIGGITT